MLYARCLVRSSGSLQVSKGRCSGSIAQFRGVLTLAIETSADDTAVAIVETQTHDKTRPKAVVHFQDKITANNAEFKGIQPRNTAISHQSELPGLIYKALRSLPRANSDDEPTISLSNIQGPLRKPDFIAATRGPGMRGALSTGLDMAKGVSLAYEIPFMGIHHMQAHALTPRLVAALSAKPGEPDAPAFPFRSLLVSGGHTMLLNAKGLTEFEDEITTVDIAAGDCIDKMARSILPAEVISGHTKDTNYGVALEKFAFPNGEADYHYVPPKSREEVVNPRPSNYQWAVSPPLRESAQRHFSFTSLTSVIKMIVEQGSGRLSETKGMPREAPMDVAERKELARHAQRVLFEHIADRIQMVLQPTEPYSFQDKRRQASAAWRKDKTPQWYRLVVSGGVASNKYFRHILSAFLKARGIGVELIFPPIDLCTDNAVMIAWAGLEMWEAGWRSEMTCNAENRWPLGSGGLVDIGGWKQI